MKSSTQQAFCCRSRHADPHGDDAYWNVCFKLWIWLSLSYIYICKYVYIIYIFTLYTLDTLYTYIHYIHIYI
jgi:hypothetical protein